MALIGLFQDDNICLICYACDAKGSSVTLRTGCNHEYSHPLVSLQAPRSNEEDFTSVEQRLETLETKMMHVSDNLETQVAQVQQSVDTMAARMGKLEGMLEILITRGSTTVETCQA